VTPSRPASAVGAGVACCGPQPPADNSTPAPAVPNPQAADCRRNCLRVMPIIYLANRIRIWLHCLLKQPFVKYAARPLRDVILPVLAGQARDRQGRLRLRSKESLPGSGRPFAPLTVTSPLGACATPCYNRDGHLSNGRIKCHNRSSRSPCSA